MHVAMSFRSKQVGQFALLVVFEFVAKWLYVSATCVKNNL